MAFGEFITFAEDLGLSTNATSTYVQKLRLTTPLVDAGDFRIAFSWLWGNSSTSNDCEVRVEQDDTTEIYRMRAEPQDGASDIMHPASGFAKITLAQGVYTFDIDFRNTASSTARIWDARLEFWMVT